MMKITRFVTRLLPLSLALAAALCLASCGTEAGKVTGDGLVLGDCSVDNTSLLCAKGFDYYPFFEDFPENAANILWNI